jgi:hypothetical protein
MSSIRSLIVLGGPGSNGSANEKGRRGVKFSRFPPTDLQTLLGILREGDAQKGVFHIVLNRGLVRQPLLVPDLCTPMRLRL